MICEAKEDSSNKILNSVIKKNGKAIYDPFKKSKEVGKADIDLEDIPSMDLFCLIAPMFKLDKLSHLM